MPHSDTTESVIETLAVGGASESVIKELAKRPRPPLGIRIVRGTGWTFIYLGALILGFVFHQLFVTDFFAERAQNHLATELEERIEVEDPTFAVVDAETGDIVQVPEAAGGGPDLTGPKFGGAIGPLFSFEAVPDKGDPIGNLRIPDIDLTWTVVEGVGLGTELKKGAGHYPKTPLPGQPGNAAIAGHRTTYGAPFHNLGELETGALILWDSLVGTHTYVVREVKIVKPTETSVLNDRSGGWLTLTTCHPKFSARQRLIVFAEIVEGPNLEAMLANA